MRLIIILFALAGIAGLNSCGRSDFTSLEAKWLLYKMNLLEGTTICQQVDSIDSIEFKSLEEVRLEFSEKIVSNDTVTFIYFFSNGVAPCHSYFHSVSVYSGSDSVLINKYGRIAFTVHRDYLEEEFRASKLVSNYNSWSSDLLILASQRGIVSTSPND